METNEIRQGNVVQTTYEIKPYYNPETKTTKYIVYRVIGEKKQFIIGNLDYGQAKELENDPVKAEAVAAYMRTCTRISIRIVLALIILITWWFGKN